MHALRVSEVKVHGEIARDFLFELRVKCIDARVRVILVKDTNRSAEGNTSQRRHALYPRPDVRSGGRAKAGKSKAGVAEDTELLHAVVPYAAHLSQHVLPAVENAIPGPQHGRAFLRKVPSEPHPRLELFLRAVQRAV